MKNKLFIIITFSVLFLVTCANAYSSGFSSLIREDKQELIYDDYKLPESMSDEEIVDYYINNKIMPASVSPEVSEGMYLNDDGTIPSYGKNECSPTDHLIKRFNGLNWFVNKNNSFDVRERYQKNAIDVDDDDQDLLVAKDLADYDHIEFGCGSLALYCELDYLVRAMGYYEFGIDMERSQDKRLLMKEILSFLNNKAVDSTSLIGQLFDVPYGTFIYPAFLIDCARTMFTKRQLMISKERIADDGSVSFYYDTDSQLLVHGDSIPNLSFKSTKINKIKESINKGMPVIWWTLSNAGYYGGHYMNIVGYETYSCDDDSATVSEHMLLKVRCNWGENKTYYVDSDIMGIVNGGFIFFEEVNKHVGLLDVDHNYECAYNNTIIHNTINKNGQTIDTSRLRTGLVNHYSNNVCDGKRLSLSSRRDSFVKAYLTWQFVAPINSFYIDLSKWSSNEWIGNGVIIELIFSSDNYCQVECIDVNHLSTLYDYPTHLKYCFMNNIMVKKVELRVTSLNTGNNKNKGRIVVSSVSISLKDYYYDGPVSLV